MRYLSLVLAMIMVLMISCKKNSVPVTIPHGTYQGTFQRSVVNETSNVTLKFSSNNFEGQSQYIHYPDICNGVFIISQDTISFQNACVYTADFDWSYILQGKFKISIFEDSVIMTRSNNGPVPYHDTYKLKKE
ncbi:MAG: hypothetical protein ABI863_20675 [Ginsengibacter sp.]